MTFDEAKSILLLHSYSHPDTDHPTLVGGFLGSLRPYTGLNETNFHAVMSAIIALAPYIQQASTIDKEVVSAVWAICGLSRAWGIRPDGMLRRNNLIMDTDVTRLEQQGLRIIILGLQPHFGGKSW